jgi:hypothetical protein
MVKELFGHPIHLQVLKAQKTTPMQKQARVSKPLLLVPSPPGAWNKKSIVV